MVKEYAQAVFKLSQKSDADPDAIVKGLVSQLKENGREKLLPRILLEIGRLTSRAQSFGEVLEIAKESERKEAERDAKEFGITAHAIVNDMLLSGWRARKGGHVIDRSGKRALLDLYGKILAKA